MPPLEEPRGIVFLCHDYGDHSSWFFRDLAVNLVRQGYGCIALDFEGHGRSDGKYINLSLISLFGWRAG